MPWPLRIPGEPSPLAEGAGLVMAARPRREWELLQLLLLLLLFFFLLLADGRPPLACFPHSTLFVGEAGLQRAKSLVTDYKRGKLEQMTPELWKAKKIVDSTLHPGTDGKE